MLEVLQLEQQLGGDYGELLPVLPQPLQLLVLVLLHPHLLQSRPQELLESELVAFYLRIPIEKGRPIALFPLRFVEQDSWNLGTVGKAAFLVLKGLEARAVCTKPCLSLGLPQWLVSIHLDGDLRRFDSPSMAFFL